MSRVLVSPLKEYTLFYVGIINNWTYRNLILNFFAFETFMVKRIVWNSEDKCLCMMYILGLEDIKHNNVFKDINISLVFKTQEYW